MTRRPAALLAVLCASAVLAQTPSPTPASTPDAAKKPSPAKAAAASSPRPSASPSPEVPKKPALTSETFSGIKARLIGPAVTSGRVMTLAVHPENTAIIYVGAASGGVWKTTNGGASWQPIFDKEGSFSIGWITLDPKRPNIVWVGTGERNSQRSVAYGDGVYKSEDGGKSWKNMGLKNSEHIGRIVVDPDNTDIVYVAAQGPLWTAGGDRGLYKTSDGGKTWEQVLKISENTGVTDVVIDPRNPNIVIASAYQRRRTFFTLIDGGPESGHPPLHRWRQDLDQGQHRPARRRARPHRPRHLQEQPRRRLRERRGREPQGRDLPQLGQRRHLGEARRLQPGLDVLRRHLRRRVRRRSGLRARRSLPGVGRRRQDVPPPRPALHARRQPHHLGRPREPETHADRQRRRPLPQLRPGGHLDLLREPPARHSSTTWMSTTPSPSTTSTAACRTTTRSAGRRARAPTTAS